MLKDDPYFISSEEVDAVIGLIDKSWDTSGVLNNLRNKLYEARSNRLWLQEMFRKDPYDFEMRRENDY